MKRVVCLVAVLLLLLCSCSKENKSQPIDVGSFSYADDCAYYKDDPGVKKSGFVNNEESEFNSAEQVVDLAKKECTVEYDTIDVAVDSETGIYRISFYKDGWVGGNQDVYINQEGITQMIIYGE